MTVHVLPCGHAVNDPGQTHYCTYLRLGELLRLQPEGEQLRHPDEHLFVVTHQGFEVWFTQLRFDLRRIVGALQRDDVGLATWLTQRCTAIARLLSPMMRVLETMTPSDFYAFRAHLSPASGTESWQWHEIEILAGAREEHFRKHLESELSGDRGSGTQAYLWTDRLAELWEQPSVASECRALFERRGIAPADAYCVSPANNPHADLVLLSEALMDFDEEVKVWRFIHARTAERTIGPDSPGTGHTTGVRYLDMAAQHRELFFPFLWEARGALWERVQARG